MTSPETYNTAEDIHVVLVGQGNTLSMYINGEFSTQTETEGIVVPGNFNFGNVCRFGWNSSDPVEVNFYSQAATAADVAASMQHDKITDYEYMIVQRDVIL